MLAELFLHVLPLLALLALLLWRRYPGEDRIVRRRLAPARSRARRTTVVRRPVAVGLPSLLARAPLSLRGPPALAI